MGAPLVESVQIAWGPELTILSAEGAVEAVLGCSAGEVVGLPLAELFQLSAAQARQLDARALAGAGEPAVEFVTVMRGDQPICFRLSLTASGDRRRAAALNLSALLEGAPPIQISRLASSLSHEIRNPLSSVKMAVQTVARNQSLSDRDRRRLAIANREIRTMERMLWLLSEYGRDTPPMAEVTSVRALVQEAASMVEPELEERQIQVDLDEEPDLPRVKVDSGRLRPVLSQLLLNVAQGLSPGGRLGIRLRRSEQGCQAVIADPGSTVLPEEERTLYEPFGSRLARGAGLSLAALKRVMLSHGGQFLAQGDESSGTTFTLTFAPA
jgi:two-component system sensor histidine kinase HydH